MPPLRQGADAHGLTGGGTPVVCGMVVVAGGEMVVVGSEIMTH